VFKLKLLFSIFLIFCTLCAILAITNKPVLAEPQLQDITWQWFSLNETEPASQSVVPKPENYLLTFTESGALQIKADCNMAQGTYSVDDKKLSIILGPSTMAACGDQSLDIMFLDLLGRIESYTFENDTLILNLQDGKGYMTFKRN
jgi:heat shock protein HslJ